jgi:hypothetical protein
MIYNIDMIKKPYLPFKTEITQKDKEQNNVKYEKTIFSLYLETYLKEIIKTLI